jgi:cytochrome c biogenesis protein
MSLVNSSYPITLESPPKVANASTRSPWSIFSTVKLTIVLLSLIAFSILLGAWCPQEAQSGQEKMIEQFGPETAYWLTKLGISDIFHTPFFLALIGLLSINLVVASFQRVFPRLSLLKLPLPFLESKDVIRLPAFREVFLDTHPEAAQEELTSQLRRLGYSVRWLGDRMTAEYGKVGRLAPTITHIGLLTLLAGVTITSWTGFSGFKPVRLGENLAFRDSEHSRLWIGKLPSWQVHVDSSRREDYETGEAKQWYSDLTVIDPSGRKLCAQEISVNNPLTYQGVDIYQSSWGLSDLKLEFNGHAQTLPLQPMGKLYASFLPLTQDLILIFSIKDEAKSLRIFAKRPDWGAPKLLGEVPSGEAIKLGGVAIKFVRAIPVTGLQYKCDPGIWVTFTAFGFIILGVLLASIPHRRLWASLICQKGRSGSCQIVFGGSSVKAKILFNKQLDRLAEKLSGNLNGHRNEASQMTAPKVEEANV